MDQLNENLSLLKTLFPFHYINEKIRVYSKLESDYSQLYHVCINEDTKIVSKDGLFLPKLEVFEAQMKSLAKFNFEPVKDYGDIRFKARGDSKDIKEFVESLIKSFRKLPIIELEVNNHLSRNDMDHLRNLFSYFAYVKFSITCESNDLFKTFLEKDRAIVRRLNLELVQ